MQEQDKIPVGQMSREINKGRQMRATVCSEKEKIMPNRVSLRAMADDDKRPLTLYLGPSFL